MKLTRSELKEIIKEELQGLQEISHTFTGNTKFMKKKMLPLMRKAGIKHVKVRDYGGGQMEVDFDVDDEVFQHLKDTLKKSLGKEGGYKWKLANLNLEGLEEELLKEQMDIRSVYYSIGDAVENLIWIAKRNTQYEKDRKLKDFGNKFLKMLDVLRKHLDKTYGDWD